LETGILGAFLGIRDVLEIRWILVWDVFIVDGNPQLILQAVQCRSQWSVSADIYDDLPRKRPRPGKSNENAGQQLSAPGKHKHLKSHASLARSVSN
jgi:hypothetical protein